ncbi:microsomal triacylglycerol transfer protein [Anticarsia gemmatalis]|uniref:microsomal triacylglycerol transfer protein n=1 Tax=Anticarsia gemmatalis TaxID=129554 RepID=UPI003F76CDE0
MRVWMRGEWCAVLCVALAAGALAVPRRDHAELRLFAPASYELDTTVLLNDAARNDKEVGYKIASLLDVAPVWSHLHTEFLLQFHLRTPKLQLRGKHALAEFVPYESVWDSHGDSKFYAHWKNGVIQAAYLHPDDPLDILNYKKSIVSLFQFQVLDGEYNETDSTGACTVLYETMSINIFRKIKRWCSADDGGAVGSARRVARYTLSAELDALDALFADEIVTLGDDELGLKARSWMRLTRRAAAPPAPPAAADLPAALAALPPGLQPRPLELAAAPAAHDEPDDEEVAQALGDIDAALEGSAGDAAAAAERVLRLLPALRRAPPARLAALLARPELTPRLATLCRLLGLAATRAAHSAVADFVQLGARDPLPELAHAYLAALALAHDPDEWVVREVLRLGEEARSPPVAESALLSAAAAARRLAPSDPAPATPGAPAASPDTLVQTVRDTLARGLARCKDERCRAVRLHALANLRRADTADLLLQHAERGAGAGGGADSLAAAAALAALPLSEEHAERLLALALDERAALELRAAALDAAVRRLADAPLELAHAFDALHERGPHELRRVLWARARELAPRHLALRRLLAGLEPRLRGWDGQAHAGTSSVLVRPTGWTGAGWSALLESVQVARGGLLRRGAVTLQLRGVGGAELDALAVHVWTRGLEAFGGADAEPAEDGEPAEEPAGGLALGVAGARMRDVKLFEGQAELLGHVWAGTASSPTEVLRALRPLAADESDVPLLGGAPLRARRDAGLALALDASAQASLWYRSARAELELRGGVAARVAADLRTAWGELAAEARAAAAPRLRIGADLDFYSGVALCVRARTDECEARRDVLLTSQQGARRLRVTRRRGERRSTPGRTLALGRPNDATCRTLRSAEPDADA